MRVAERLTTVLAICLVTLPCAASKKTIQRETLSDYIQRMQLNSGTTGSSSLGSLWLDDGTLANLATDYKAMHVGDSITILVVQDTAASNSGDVSSDRTLKANSGIS